MKDETLMNGNEVRHTCFIKGFKRNIAGDTSENALVVQWHDASLPSKRPGFDSRLARFLLLFG